MWYLLISPRNSQFHLTFTQSHKSTWKMRGSVHLWIRKDGMELQYATVDANSHILTIPLCRTLNSECRNQDMLSWNCRRWHLANLKITHHVRKQTHASMIYLLVAASVHDLISSKFHQISPQRKEKSPNHLQKPRHVELKLPEVTFGKPKDYAPCSKANTCIYDLSSGGSVSARSN